MDYGEYTSRIPSWVRNCYQTKNIGAYLDELTPYERDIFWHFLENEIPRLDNDRIIRKYYALSHCKPEDKAVLELENYKLDDQQQYESVFEKWKIYNSEKTLSKKNASKGGKIGKRQPDIEAIAELKKIMMGKTGKPFTQSELLNHTKGKKLNREITPSFLKKHWKAITEK